MTLIQMLHQQRAANLRSMMLMLEMGVGLRFEVVEQPVIALPAKDGAS